MPPRNRTAQTSTASRPSNAEQIVNLLAQGRVPLNVISTMGHEGELSPNMARPLRVARDAWRYIVSSDPGYGNMELDFDVATRGSPTQNRLLRALQHANRQERFR